MSDACQAYVSTLRKCGRLKIAGFKGSEAVYRQNTAVTTNGVICLHFNKVAHRLELQKGRVLHMLWTGYVRVRRRSISE